MEGIVIYFLQCWETATTLQDELQKSVQELNRVSSHDKLTF